MTLELNATQEEVMRAVETLQQFGRDQGFTEKEMFGLALALAECGANVVEHALRGDARQKFRVRIEQTGGAIAVELRDGGPEFDPTTAPERPSSGEEDEDRVGGWGISLVRRHVDEILYRREQGENILQLKKRLRPANGAQEFSTE